MKTFFVTGLPRSRTAWMAAYLCYGNTFCFHDGFVGLSHPSQICERFESMHKQGFSLVGNSDPANLYFLDSLTSQFPDAKWIILNRDIDECRKSSEEAFGYYTDLDFERNQLDKLKSKGLDLIEIDYRNLDRLSVIQAVHHHLNQYLFPWMMERHSLFCTMNIQLTAERLSRRDLVNLEIMNHIDKTNECILA